ncbi:ribosomal protein S18-alanine N-acetyltransferase [Actimicrobium sp. CCC2.4]|uniref:ribosomal protein S18-alanine N-acetyltransferase n=1 Tax=Actimicrobium sp. CCC2.4 TaxID=3048606 RepID=UPI002AC943E7|nr:ribosomal protein S18-alanine N-acetyltransferase [Actimicrobium sp. CCC2.4]MEB0133891.1 ribosomal protein S18-alanine N-acetyltransferase [Actimicrobium sp. CCC2.4]WPX31432.1 ribosomal protein S18-alanine N-acetyltransferase [Actimicrobium sp. CCC2.4]
MNLVARPLQMPYQDPSLQFRSMTEQDLDEVVAIEDVVYPHPWSRGNFSDSIRSGYQARVLRDGQGVLLGYFLLMLSVDEAHLLNISVRIDLHGRGLGRLLLAEIITLAKQLGMLSVLLEVRPSNHRALVVYERYGFVRIGLRKNYYPADTGAREDAIVMRFVP